MQIVEKEKVIQNISLSIILCPIIIDRDFHRYLSPLNKSITSFNNKYLIFY